MRWRPVRLFLVLCLLPFVPVLVYPWSAHAGCEKDTDCKGDRICDQGECKEPVAPTFVTSEPSLGGCEKDTDCKGDRICEQGACIDPANSATASTAAREQQDARVEAHYGSGLRRERPAWLFGGVGLAAGTTAVVLSQAGVGIFPPVATGLVGLGFIISAGALSIEAGGHYSTALRLLGRSTAVNGLRHTGGAMWVSGLVIAVVAISVGAAVDHIAFGFVGLGGLATAVTGIAMHQAYNIRNRRLLESVHSLGDRGDGRPALRLAAAPLVLDGGGGLVIALIR